MSSSSAYPAKPLGFTFSLVEGGGGGGGGICVYVNVF